jgi:hypothetical protein
MGSLIGENTTPLEKKAIKDPYFKQMLDACQTLYENPN